MGSLALGLGINSHWYRPRSPLPRRRSLNSCFFKRHFSMMTISFVAIKNPSASSVPQLRIRDYRQRRAMRRSTVSGRSLYTLSHSLDTSNKWTTRAVTENWFFLLESDPLSPPLSFPASQLSFMRSYPDPPTYLSVMAFAAKLRRSCGTGGGTYVVTNSNT